MAAKFELISQLQASHINRHLEDTWANRLIAEDQDQDQDLEDQAQDQGKDQDQDLDNQGRQLLKLVLLILFAIQGILSLC